MPNKYPFNKFPENLKALRKSYGLTQYELANMLEITQQCISEWELNKTEPTLTYLWRLADIFETTIDSLCGRED